MALAYMGSNYLAMLAYGLYLACAKDMRPYQFFNFGRLGLSHFDQLTDILKMGLPIMVSTASDNIVALLLGVFAGLMGKEQLGALNDIMSLYFFVFIGPMIKSK